jgi:hypothetical protein
MMHWSFKKAYNLWESKTDLFGFNLVTLAWKAAKVAKVAKVAKLKPKRGSATQELQTQIPP